MFLGQAGRGTQPLHGAGQTLGKGSEMLVDRKNGKAGTQCIFKRVLRRRNRERFSQTSCKDTEPLSSFLPSRQI
jgi:hypothetical protein